MPRDDVHRTDWRRKHVALLAVVGALEGVMHMAAPGDTDILWGARSGIDVLRTGRLPHIDTYSWTAHGRTWIPNSWAWNVVLGALYKAAGMAGFAIAACLVGGCLGVVISALAKRAGAKPLPTIIVFAGVGAFALGGTPRATSVSAVVAPFVLLAVPALLTASRTRWLRLLVALAGVQVAWANLHSGALLGPVVVGAYGLGIAVRQQPDARRRAVARLSVTVAALGACCAATPYGFATVSHSLEVRSSSTGLIEEWRHYSLGMLLTPTGALAALAVLLALGIAYRAKRCERVFVLLVMLALTLSAVRFTATLLVFVIPELALGLSRLVIRPLVLRLAAAVVVTGLLGVILNWLTSFQHAEEVWASPRLVAELPSGCRLVNDYAAGGSVILHRPDVPVFIDGRNDMYGRRLTEQAFVLLQDRPGTTAWLDEHGVTCVLAQKSDSITKRLQTSAGWRTVDSDAVRVLLVRS
jgi:hypothetical protein